MTLADDYTPVDWTTLFETVSTEPDWLVTDVLARGYMYALHSAVGVGKSLFCQWVAATLAQRGHSVLYIDLENSKSDLRKRFGSMVDSPMDLKNLVYFSFPSLPVLDSPAGGVHLAALVEKYGPDLVIIDTTSRVISGEENGADTFHDLNRYAMQPLKGQGIAVVRIDHSGKDGELRGSSAKSSDVDVVWKMTRNGEHYTLNCRQKDRSGEHPLCVTYTKVGDPLRFERTDNPVERLIATLDRLQVPNEAGREACRKALKTSGYTAADALLNEAIRTRKTRFDPN